MLDEGSGRDSKIVFKIENNSPPLQKESGDKSSNSKTKVVDNN
jgi:hypothetical protein